MLELNRKLPAKILKRAAQLRRLGPKGLVHTAYVRTLGPAFYSITDPARKVAAKRHRRRSLEQSLPNRLARLKARALQTPENANSGTILDFRTDLGRFVQTLEAMLDLQTAGCAVSRVISIDWSANVIIMEAVDGEVIDPSVQGELDDETTKRLEDVLVSVHHAGYALGDISREDIVLGADGEVRITNLTRAYSLRGLSRDMSAHVRDLDRSKFNELFCTKFLTAAELRGLLSPNATIPHDRLRGRFSEVYAPVVIRDDIRWGKIWNTDLGTGRWNFIMKEHLPISQGGSLLDLGSNNGFNPLQMLRAGAASAVGIEIHEPAIEQAMFLKSAYEWLDNRSYDFRCIHASQGDLPKLDLPRFDMITAFCSLYYLPDAEIRDLVRHIRTRTDMLVLQCNTDRLIDRGGSEETYRKASVEFAIEMLELGGFPNRQVIAPPGYSRPLVIGRAS